MHAPFGTILKDLREKSGLNVAQLAKLCHVAAPTISMIENGKRRLPKRAEESCATALGLLGDERNTFLEQAQRHRMMAQPGAQPIADVLEARVEALEEKLDEAHAAAREGQAAVWMLHAMLRCWRGEPAAASLWPQLRMAMQEGPLPFDAPTGLSALRAAIGTPVTVHPGTIPPEAT